MYGKTKLNRKEKGENTDIDNGPSRLSGLAVKMARREECIPQWMWHAFDALDGEKSGKVPKGTLKVLNAHISNSLGDKADSSAFNAGFAQRFGDSNTISFEDYRNFLENPEVLVLGDVDLAKLEEVSWMICGKQYQKRSKSVLGQGEVYKLWRIFNFFAEPGTFPVVMDLQEATIMFEKLVVAMGTKWSSEDFQFKAAALLQDLQFMSCLLFFESHYTEGVDKMCIVEGIKEVHNAIVEEVEKMGPIKKKGHKMTNWKDRWFILKPGSMAYFVDKSVREQKGDIPIDTSWKAEIIPDQGAYRNMFVLHSEDTSHHFTKRRYEMSASDPKTRQEWLTAIENVRKRMESGQSPHVMALERRRAERRQKREEAEEVDRLRRMQVEENERQRQRLQEMERARDEAARRAEEELARRMLKEKEEEENRRREMEERAKTQEEIDALRAARNEAARMAEEELARRIAKEREEEEKWRREMEEKAKTQEEIDALKAARDEAARMAEEELARRIAKEREEEEKWRREMEEKAKTQEEIDALKSARDEASRKAAEELALRMAKEEEERENRRRETEERERTQKEIDALKAAKEESERRAQEEAARLAERQREEEERRQKEDEERRRIEEEEKAEYARQLEELKRAYEDATKKAEIEARLKEANEERLAELKDSVQELALLLDAERRAKKDEELVRAAQARILKEEMERRDHLEKLREEQEALLHQEQEKREHLEQRSEELVQQRQEQARQLEAERERLRELEEERKAADEKLKSAMEKLTLAEEAKKRQEQKKRELEKPVGLARLIQPSAKPLTTHRGAGAFTEGMFRAEMEKRQMRRNQEKNSTTDGTPHENGSSETNGCHVTDTNGDCENNVNVEGER